MTAIFLIILSLGGVVEDSCVIDYELKCEIRSSELISYFILHISYFRFHTSDFIFQIPLSCT
jgi:hypothetical protein